MTTRSPFGKRTVPKHTKVPEETAELLAALAREAGKTESDFIATLIELRCHGFEAVDRVRRQELEIVSGTAPKARQKVGRS